MRSVTDLLPEYLFRRFQHFVAAGGDTSRRGVALGTLLLFDKNFQLTRAHRLHQDFVIAFGLVWADPNALGLVLLGMAPCSPAIPVMMRRSGGSLAYMSAFMLLAYAGTVTLMPFMGPG